jgi:hypothetical protein
MTTVAGRSRQSVSQTLADQLAPVIELYDELRSACSVHVDLDRAELRVHVGRPAIDPMLILEEAGDLNWPISQAFTAFERAGLATTSEVFALQRFSWDAAALIGSWANGDRMPSDPIQRLARRSAALVGAAILRGAADQVAPLLPSRPERAESCPCCGGSPDLALASSRSRTLVCARCDTRWETELSGCLGCGASAAPALVRVRSPYLGYTLVVCNACGRYLKERIAAEDCVPLIERELTSLLDEAAADRGFRI